MKLKSTIAAAAIALSSFGAFASNSTFVGGLATIDSDPFGSTGIFTQTVSFSGLSSGTYEISGDLSSYGLTLTSVSLDGQNWTLFGTGSLAPLRFAYFEGTGNQPLLMTVTGEVTNRTLSKVNFSGSVAVTPVPEPETFAMLLAGLGLMGAIARRRNKTVV